MRDSSLRKTAFFLLKFSFFSAFLIFFAIFLGHRIMGVTPSVPVDAVPAPKTVTVVVDAGHGGRDGGAMADDDGTLEKDLNLAVAEKLASLLRLADVEVIMTREGDIELADPASHHKKLDDLNARVAMAKAAEGAILVSIHMNKFPVAKYSGLQVYYSENNEKSRTLAETIQSTAATGLATANSRHVKPAGDSIYLLHHLDIPAVLVECGFLSNYEEKELLKTEEYQTRLAVILCAAILNDLAAQADQ